MLKTLLGKSLGSGEAKEPPWGSGTGRTIDLDKLKTLIDFFPIGKRLRYYPEFKEEVVFDTFVVAHCANGNIVYSGEAICRDARGNPTAFHAGESKESTPLAELKLFQLLVPDTSDLEMKLDYQRRALIGRGRQFTAGNCISLISNGGGKGVATVDTEVAKHVLRHDGPYAHARMILLTPELDTLAVTDQRSEARAKTCAPVTLSWLEGKLSGSCTIVDVSAGTLRIRVHDRNTTQRALYRGDEVTLDFDLGEAERHYTVKGLVIRRSPETCVIQLEALFKDGTLGSFGALDLLELKADLLNYRQ